MAWNNAPPRVHVDEFVLIVHNPFDPCRELLGAAVKVIQVHNGICMVCITTIGSSQPAKPDGVIIDSEDDHGNDGDDVMIVTRADEGR